MRFRCLKKFVLPQVWFCEHKQSRAAADNAQCICVGAAAVYRIPLWGQECTAWL